MAACYTADARLLAENTELIKGRPTIELFWRLAIDPGKRGGSAPGSSKPMRW
jgi:hypothetical protein